MGACPGLLLILFVVPRVYTLPARGHVPQGIGGELAPAH
jgi:hypothetical protein